MSQLETSLPDGSARSPVLPWGSREAPLPAATGFQILTEIACTINSVLDLDQLYWVTYEQCSRVLETENFWIGRCTDGENAQAALWFYHGKQIVPPGETIPVAPGLNSEVLRTRSTLRVSNYAAATRERGFPLDEGPGADANHAWIGVPMLVADRLIGIIANSRAWPFTADDARLLEAIAALCAVAIENAGLVQLVSETAQDLMRSTQELSDLNRVARAVNRSLDLPTVLDEGVQMLLRVTGWDTATICLQDAAGRWEIAQHRDTGLFLDPPAEPGPLDGGDLVPPDSPLAPLVRTALLAGRPVAVDLSTLLPADGTGVPAYLAEGLHRLVLFPLRTGPGEGAAALPVLGLLLLGSRAGSAGKGVAEMLRDTTLLAIGEQLATAVQNARLLADVQTARSHLSAVLESTADGVIFYTPDLHIELANRAAHEVYSLPPGTLIGRSAEDAAALVQQITGAPSQLPVVAARLRAAAPDAMYMEEFVTQVPRYRVFQRSVRPVRDDGGAILGRLVVYHDITEAKDLERRTRELAALEERQRLARELHDSVTQSLFTITLMAEAAQAMAGRDPGRVAPYLERLKSTAGTALEEMRALLAQLRPSVVGTSGLGPALRRHAETVRAQVGLPVSVVITATLDPLPGPVEEALFRIAQEALHNIVKHAAARQARVTLARQDSSPVCRPPRLILTVEDDGCGFTPPAFGSADAGRGLGLTSMRERAVALGGELSVESVPGQGSRVTAAVPLMSEEP